MTRSLACAHLPLGIGVAGLGRAGACHIERIGLREDCRVVAAIDDSAEAIRKGPGKDAIPTRIWNDLLQSDEVEVVLLATPPATHARLVIEALAAGKHVLVETPLCLNLAEADAIMAAARRTARSVMVAHTRRWDDDFRRALQCVRDGSIGRLRSVKSVTWQYVPAARVARDAAAPDENGQGAPSVPSWRHDRGCGGGALWEFGLHLFDQLLLLARERPVSVFLEPYRSSLSQPGDDGFLAVVRFASGLVAHIEVDRASPVPLQTGWMLVGAAGSYASATHFSVTEEGEVVDVPLDSCPAETDDFYASVVRHVRGLGPNPIPAEEARRSIALVEAAIRSVRTGAPAAVEP